MNHETYILTIRAWVAREFLMDDTSHMSNQEVMTIVSRHYDGGLAGFKADAESGRI